MWVGDKPIMETIIHQFSKKGFHNFYISTHYKAKGLRWTLLANYHLANKTPYILKENFKAEGMELGRPMRIPYSADLNKII